MSSTVNMDMALIATSNILPSSRLKEVFEECVKELGYTIKHDRLFLENIDLGILTIKDRIVLTFSSDLNNSKKTEIRQKLRETFTRRVEIAHENYLYDLKQKKEELTKESLVEKELLESLKNIDKEIKKSEVGFERQQLSECEALKAEIMDAAVAQGYEVVEENTENGVQLQFIRRDY